jgi:outer membrane immunogenic protein
MLYHQLRGLFAAGGVAAVALLCPPAFSADMPVKAPPMAVAPYDPWTGCYIGGNAGGGWGHEIGHFSNGTQYIDNKPSGFIGGGQLGCDYHSGSRVVGIRGLFDWSSMKDTKGNVFNPTGFFEHTKISNFGTATARIGALVQPNTLLYVDGGWAWAKYKRFEDDAAGVFQFSENNNPSGWTIGAGLEWLFAPNWTLFVEYDYLNFGAEAVAHSTGGAPSTIKDNVNAVLVGLNYRFGSGGKGPVVAKY